jgi:intraflagellar transport protein 122
MIFKTTISWRNQLTDKQGRRRCIFDISLHPGGEKLVIAVESSIEVLSTADGRILNKLNAHKGDVHSLSHSRDGSYFASGSADKTVIIWSNDLEGRLKYSHADAIQCVAYNPVSHQVLSCGVNDIGLWSPEHRTVARRKVPSRVCSCSWTNDGQYFALGFYNGSITIWTKVR